MADQKVESLARKLSLEVRELSLGTSGEIERIQGAPTPLRFLRDFVLPNKPCIIAHAIDHWPALTAWTNSYLLSSLRHEKVSVHFTPDGHADALVDLNRISSVYGCTIDLNAQKTEPLRLSVPSCSRPSSEKELLAHQEVTRKKAPVDGKHVDNRGDGFVDLAKGHLVVNREDHPLDIGQTVQEISHTEKHSTKPMLDFACHSGRPQSDGDGKADGPRRVQAASVMDCCVSQQYNSKLSTRLGLHNSTSRCACMAHSHIEQASTMDSMETCQCVLHFEKHSPRAKSCDLSCNASLNEERSQKLWFVTAHVERLPFSRALDLILHSGMEHGVAYAQEQNGCFLSEYSVLSADAETHLPWATEALGCMPEAVNLWIGNEKAVTSFHKDHYENLYAVIAGEKHFTLLPPTDVHCLYIQQYPLAHYTRHKGKFSVEQEKPVTFIPWVSVDPYPPPEEASQAKSHFPGYFSGAQPFTCTLRAGEILYLPSMWFHHVRQSPDSEGRTIALNFWYDMQFDVKYAYFNFLESLIIKHSATLDNRQAPGKYLVGKDQ